MPWSPYPAIPGHNLVLGSRFPPASGHDVQWGRQFDFGEFRIGNTVHRVADAEVAKQLGGMIALCPRADDAHKLAIPGGEPVEDLHVTLVYLGEDVSGTDPSALYSAVASLIDTVTVITARVLGHAVFNPDGGDPEDVKEPCAVYLISDSEQLDDLHTDILHAAQENLPDLHPQHKPWTPHITAGYNMDPAELSYTGPILFDRVSFNFAGDDHYFPLMGATTSY